MFKWFKSKFNKKPVKFRSVYEDSLGFFIKLNGSFKEGHIFRYEKDTDVDMRLKLISYVYKECLNDGQPIEEKLEQIEKNLKINNLCEEEIVL